MTARSPIDFVGLAAALLDRAKTLLPAWLPDGDWSGPEYHCADFSGGPGKSLSINANTGKWADFATDDRGGDLISLYAAIHNISNLQAALRLMDEMGIARSAPADAQPRVSRPERSENGPGDMRPQPPDEAESGPQTLRRKSLWRPVVPVPDHAPEPTFKHWHREEKDRVATWAYRLDGQLFGYVVRFQTSDGGKDTLPYTWCVDESDDRGTRRWHWKTWEAPRPLYVPAQTLAGDLPVLVVEGEKCALAAHELIGDVMTVVSWPGGGKAVAMAQWDWLAGRTVVMWPDADAKRKRLSQQERADGVDPASKPLLERQWQPGIRAMVQLGDLLLAKGCAVSMLHLPDPGDLPDGWDVADAIADGWTREQVLSFIEQKVRVHSTSNDALRAVVVSQSTPSMTGVGADAEAQAWRSALITTAQGAIKPCRENIVLALDGQQTSRGRMQGIAEVEGIIAFDEFSNEVLKLKDTPWGSPAGKWTEVDELHMGEWLVREHWLPSVPRGTLEEAVAMVAHRHRFHPVRKRLEGLKHDGTPRLDTWLRRVCLDGGDDEGSWNPEDPLQRYLALAGRFYLMGMVARVFFPGFKFDYMLILEGEQGMLKSSLFRTLAGEYFSDTGLTLGDKDSYQQLQGRWLYEFSELDSFAKADITKIKAFIASVSDYFRASFDRRARDYPRQLVFGGSTNEDHYLSDPTGNRRFWPVRVTRRIDIDWVVANLDQLFAEARDRVLAGERAYPSAEEERDLFVPQQRERTVESAIEIKIGRYLYDENQRVSMHGENGTLVNEITLVELLDRIGIGIEKLGPGRYHEKQAAAALRKHGWTEKRSSRPPRPWVWCRPANKPLQPGPDVPRGSNGSTRRDAGESTSEGADDCPF